MRSSVAWAPAPGSRAARTGNETSGTSMRSTSASERATSLAASSSIVLGSRIEAIAPSIDSGAIGSGPSRSLSIDRASIARARFAAMCAGQPPGRRPPTTRIASGRHRNAVGFVVPCQSNSRHRSGRSSRGSLRPWLVTSGSSPRLRSSRTTSIPAPLGPHSHLWPLPVQYAAPSAETSSGSSPGAWAASTSVSTPSRSSSRTMVSIGKTRPLGLVTWLTSASRVRGVTAASSASTTSSGWRIGSRIRARTTRAFARSATASSALSVALYSWSSVSSSSPGRSRSEARTVATPVVALGTGTSPSGSACRKAATLRRASSTRVSSSRVRNRIGFASSSATSARWSSRMGRGQAPYVPCVRYVTSGSRSQGRSGA
jgi:hypothetical protein